MTDRQMAHFLLVSLSKMPLMLFLLFLLFISVSCSKSTNETTPLGEQELPDMILEDAQYTLGRPNEDALIMKAARIEIYRNEKGTTLENVEFWQNNSNGFRGSCSLAETNQDNNHAVLTGNVEISRESDNIQIYAQNIEWNNDQKSLQTTGVVKVVYGDGTEIEAQGFYAELDKNLFEFESIIRGTINEQ